MKCLLYLALTLFVSLHSFAQSNTVKGAVTDDKGNPLPATSVVEKGTPNGTTTDQNGNFTITVKPNAVLVISSVGHETTEFQLKGQTVVSVMLASAGKSLTDVVVVAYGTQRRTTMTSSQSSISSKDFEGQPVTRIDQALQGRSSGVQVTNTSGAPGSDVRIRIRGANSINGDNGPLYVIDGFVGGDFNIINPDDVADIQILKDAAATAPYGSRGANGVIIITTKKGVKGKTSISFNTRQSLSDVIKKYDKLTAAEYAEVVNQRRQLTGTDPYYTAEQINNFKTNPVKDAQDEIYRRAAGQQYELNLSGGTDKTTYFISGGYQDLQGVIVGSGYKFYNIRSNINTSLSDKLSAYINVNAFVRNNRNTSLRAGTQNAVVESVAWSPSVNVIDADGNPVKTDPLGAQFYNPVAEALHREGLNDNYNANIAGGFLYRIVNGLTFNLQYGVNYSNGEYRGFGDKYVAENVYAGRSTGTSLTLQNINTLNYKATFNGVHNLDLTGVLELQKEKYSGFNIDVRNLIYPAFKWDNLRLADLTGAGAGYSNASLFSLFGRVNYNYDERYLLSATIRRDGSSRFRGDNRYSYFPSVAAGWVISKENFMADQGLFSLLKLTASWGLTGNQAIGAYSTLSTYASLNTTLSADGSVPAILIDRAANPDLKWETTEQKNLGLEMGVLKNRLKARFDYFTKDTRDLLFWVGLPAYTGGGAIMRNVGNVQNKGWELEISGTPVVTEHFSWNSSFNYSAVNNKIRTLADGKAEQTWDSDIGWGATVYPEYLLKVGQPMGAMYGLNYLGTWKPKDEAEAAQFNEKPGDSRYQDVNGDHVIDANDLTIIGYGLPKYTMGWNNTFTYKGLELNILLQGVYGFDKLNFIYAMGMTAYGDFRQPTLADIKNRYVPGVNETSDIPAFSTTNKNYVQSSRFISKGDFTRIKNVSLAYTLPKKLIRNIADIRLFASVTNLYTFTKYSGMDPEAANTGSGSDPAQSFDYGGYPIPRTFTGGITLTF
ncbi:MAG: TonB-dependent receptor [Chitinophagaceae bacterium]|nr:TonB-dependent receptor [Chitinophagaceae bacterium]